MGAQNEQHQSRHTLADGHRQAGSSIVIEGIVTTATLFPGGAHLPGEIDGQHRQQRADHIAHGDGIGAAAGLQGGEQADEQLRSTGAKGDHRQADNDLGNSQKE